MSSVINYFEQFKEIGVLIVSMIPVIELRGAIPTGVAIGINPLVVYLLSVVGNMIPVPFILAFIRPIFNCLKKTKMFGFVKKIEDRAMNKSKKVQEKSIIGLMLFVAVPLPGTGAWTGALIASLLNMRYKYALPSIFMGVVVSGAIVLGITLLLEMGIVQSGFLKTVLEFFA